MTVALENSILTQTAISEFASNRFEDVSPALIYLKRFPVIHTDEAEMSKFGPVPNIKNGTIVGEQMRNRLMAELKSEDDYNLILNWRNRTVQLVIEGIHQRMNILACEAACNAPDALQETALYLWGHPKSTPITDIRRFVKKAKKQFGVVYDRITLAKNSLLLAFNTPEFSLARDAYSELFDVEIEHTFEQDLDIFAQLAKVRVEVDDSHYGQRNADGKVVMYRVLPEGKVCISSTAYDNNRKVADFGVAPVVDSNFSQMAHTSPLAYLSLQPEENSTKENLVVWAAAKGNVRRHEFTYTGVLSAHEPTKKGN